MRSFRFVVFTALIIFISSWPSASQDILVKALSVEDGLSQSSVNSIVQDQFGITWISTGDGLNSYDGAILKSFYSMGGTKNTNLSINNSIRRVLPDSSGNLWVGCDQGILYFDRFSNSLTQCFDTLSNLQKQSCLPLFISGDTLIILAGRMGIVSIHLPSQIAITKFKCQSLSHLNLSVIDKNEIWFGSFPNRLNQVTYRNNHLLVDTFSMPAPHLGMVCQIVKTKKQQYLVIGTNQLHQLNTNKKSIKPLATEEYNFTGSPILYKTAIIDFHNNIWIALDNGSLLILDSNLEFKRNVRLIKQPDDPSSVFSAIMCLYQDTFGNIWAGSDGKGMVIFRPEQLDFNPVRRIISPSGIIDKPFVRAFEEDESGRIWIGTYNEGILLRNSAANSFTRLMPQSNLNFPSKNDIYTLKYFNENELLAGTSAGLISINPHNFDVTTILGSKDPDLVLKVHQIERFTSESILLLVNKNLRKFCKIQNKWIEDQDFKTENIHFDWLCLHKDSIFAFSTIGFIIQTKDLIQKSDYRYLGKSIRLEVNSAYYDPIQQLFWMCTENGLLQMSKEGEIHKWYGTGDGLSNHYLYGLLPDLSGNLWISSNGGISRFNKETERFENFGYLDGLQSLEFNTGAFYSSRNGEFYFGGINGFNHFYPDSIQNKTESASIILRKLLVNDEEYPCQLSDLCKKDIQLAHSQNTLTFEFQGLDYLNQSGIKYTYQLKNWDQDWVSGDRNTQVRYSKLKPGNYVFQVKDARHPKDEDGMLQIRFHIDKPYWREFWFQIPVLILLLSVMLLIFRWISTISMRKKIAQLEEQKRINTIRSRIASDLHDDIGAGLSKLAMISEAASFEKQDKSKNELQNITNRTRQMIDQLRMIVWTLDPPDESLDELIAFMRAKTGELMDQLEMDYQFNAPESTEVKQISPEFRRNVYYAVREAIHNAIKHSRCKKILLEINLSKSTLHISIEDNGIGFERESNTSRGYGLKGMERRISEIKGIISIKSEKGKGTLVQFAIPLEITT